jgi:hypothetical protein
VGTWEGEVSFDGPPVLRTWTSLQVTAQGEIVLLDSLDNGTMASVVLDELEPPDALGHRQSGDFIVDDRFREIDGLEAPATVVVAVRVDADEQVWLSPLPGLP